MPTSFRWLPGQVFEVAESGERVRRFRLLRLLSAASGSLGWLADEVDGGDGAEGRPIGRVILQALRADASASERRAFEERVAGLQALSDSDRARGRRPALGSRVVAASPPGATAAFVATERLILPSLIDAALPVSGSSRQAAPSEASFADHLSLARGGAGGEPSSGGGGRRRSMAAPAVLEPEDVQEWLGQRSGLTEDEFLIAGAQLCRALQVLTAAGVTSAGIELARVRWDGASRRAVVAALPLPLADLRSEEMPDALLELARDLFWLCTLVRPPEAGATPAVLSKLGGRAWNERVSRSLRLILARALDPDPQLRFKGAYDPADRARARVIPTRCASLGGALEALYRLRQRTAEGLIELADRCRGLGLSEEARGIEELARAKLKEGDQGGAAPGTAVVAGTRSSTAVAESVGRAEEWLRSRRPDLAEATLSSSLDGIGPTTLLPSVRRGLEVSREWLALRRALDLLSAADDDGVRGLAIGQEELRAIVDGLAGRSLDVLGGMDDAVRRAVAEDLAERFESTRQLDQLIGARALLELERRLLGTTPAEHVTAAWAIAERVREGRRDLSADVPSVEPDSSAPGVSSKPAPGGRRGREARARRQEDAGRAGRGVDDSSGHPGDDERGGDDSEKKVRDLERPEDRDSERLPERQQILDARAAESAERVAERLLESAWPDDVEEALRHLDRARGLYRQARGRTGEARAIRRLEEVAKTRTLLSEAAGNALVLYSLLDRPEAALRAGGLPSPFDQPLASLRSACDELLTARYRDDYVAALALVPVVVGWHELVRRSEQPLPATTTQPGQPRSADDLIAWLARTPSPHHATAHLMSWLLGAAQGSARRQPDSAESLLAAQRRVEGTIKALADRISGLESQIGLLEVPPIREPVPRPVEPAMASLVASAGAPGGTHSPVDPGRPADGHPIGPSGGPAQLADAARGPTGDAPGRPLVGRPISSGYALTIGLVVVGLLAGGEAGRALIAPSRAQPSPASRAADVPSARPEIFLTSTAVARQRTGAAETLSTLWATTPPAAPSALSGTRSADGGSALRAAPSATLASQRSSSVQASAPGPTASPPPTATPAPPAVVGTPTAVPGRGNPGKSLDGVFAYVQPAQALADTPPEKRVGTFHAMQPGGFVVVGRNRDGTALKVEPRGPGLISGWVRAEYVELGAGLAVERLPILE